MISECIIPPTRANPSRVCNRSRKRKRPGKNPSHLERLVPNEAEQSEGPALPVPTHHSPFTTHRPAGTLRFSSSNQFSTTWICVGACSGSTPAASGSVARRGFCQSREGYRATTRAATLCNFRFMGDGPHWRLGGRSFTVAARTNAALAASAPQTNSAPRGFAWPPVPPRWA